MPEKEPIYRSVISTLDYSDDDPNYYSAILALAERVDELQAEIGELKEVMPDDNHKKKCDRCEWEYHPTEHKVYQTTIPASLTLIGQIPRLPLCKDLCTGCIIDLETALRTWWGGDDA